MHLKRLDLFGFKSFPEQLSLEFGPGITGLVGPNGSGKSNLCDAVRWVLGEQNARVLRGQKMEDVIFGGSEGRKALGMAEVTLVFDNADGVLPLDFTEISVTRRAFRSGEGEYYLNKVPCRLKDVLELLADTGVGREAYSIIGQGRIEEVLSLKAEDRRGLFEEAAGITKHRNRRREAERKLGETQRALDRIADILTELEDQLGPLEEQYRQALEYKRYREEYRQLEVGLARRDLSEFDQRLARLEERQRTLSDQVSGGQAKVLEGEARFRQLGGEAREAEELVLTAQARLLKEQARAEALAERLAAARQRLSACELELEGATRGEQALSQRVTALAGEVSGLEARQQQEAERLGTIQAELARLEGDLAGARSELAAAESSVSGYKDELFEVMRLAADGRSELQARQFRLEAAQRRLDRSLGAVAAAKQAHAEARAKADALSQSASAQQEAAATGEGDLHALHQEEVGLQRELGELERSCAEAKQAAVACGSRLKALEEMERRYEGYGRGARSLLTGKSAGDTDCQGIIGSVAQLVKVPAEYRRAIETALGASLQHLVVKSEEDIKRLIARLKGRGEGRATFLALDVIKGSAWQAEDRQLLGMDKVVGTADTLVEFEPALREVVQYLLGRVMVAVDLPAALKVGRAGRYRFKVVTLDGDVVHRGGPVSGGAEAAGGGSLLRSAEVERLRGEAVTLQHKAEALESAREHARLRLAEMGKGRLALEQELYRSRARLGSLQRDAGEAAAAAAKHSAELEVGALEVAQAREEADEQGRQRLDRAEALRALMEREAALREALAGAEGDLAGLRGRPESMSARVMELKVAEATAKELRQQAEAGVSAAKSRLDELSEELAARGAKAGELREERLATQGAIASWEQQQAELAAAAAAAEAELKSHRERREELAQEQSELEASLRAWRRSVESAGGRLTATEVEVARLAAERSHLLDAIREDYDLDLTGVGEEQAVSDAASARVRLDEVRRLIHGLGDVNLGALEEYQRVSERREFLFSQRRDMAEACRDLQQVIAEMDELMRKRFLEQFSAIRLQFARVFEYLFGGGRAELELAEADSPLESGIELYAQPPGKRLQSLALLSGGERALTAIALLFAMLRVRPSPLVVLDEIDAALDETNVERFSRFLKEYAADSQFLVVTHQKQTMAVCGSLHGVTMEEGGVSKLISVKLTRKAG